MRWKVCSLFVLAAAVATSAVAGEKCTEATQTCLNHFAAEQGTKGWLGIEKEKTADGMVKVTKVVAGSPAEKAGFKAGDLLVSINGMKLGSDELKAAYKNYSQAGSSVKYTVVRDGKNQELQATLVKMPEENFAQMLGSHMLEHATLQSAAK